MNIGFFLVLFSIFAFAYFAVGIAISKKMKTNDDYFLAGRSLEVWSLTLTLIATQLGGGMILGSSQEAYYLGIYGVLYNLGICGGFFLLGLGFASMLRGFNITTVAELFEVKYGSPLLRSVASLLSAISLFGILVGQVVAARSVFWGLGIESDLVLLVFWILLILNTVIGGLWAVVVIDSVQVLVIVAIFLTLFVLGLATSPFSLREVVAFSFKIAKSSQPTTIFAPSRLFGLFLMPMLFSLIEQDLAQKFFAARSKKIARTSAFLSGAFIVLFALIPVYFGVVASMSKLAIPLGANPLIAFFDQKFGSAALAFVLCGIFAAIASTANSLLSALSSNIAQDSRLHIALGVPPVVFSRAITFVAGLLALGCGYSFKNVLDVISQSYELLVSCFLVSLLFCFSSVRLKRQSAFLSVVFGLAGFLFFRLVSPPLPRELASLLLSLAGYLVAQLLF